VATDSVNDVIVAFARDFVQQVCLPFTDRAAGMSIYGAKRAQPVATGRSAWASAQSRCDVQRLRSLLLG
jgi:hypothetical protein